MASLEDSCPGPLSASDGAVSVDLLARAQAGDDAARDELVERYQERLLRIVRVRLGPRGRGLRRFLESTDVAQETWRAALAGLGGLRLGEGGDLSRWLARIATNEIRDLVDHVRAQRRARERERALESPSRIEPADSVPGPDALAERAELGELLDATVSELPEDQREVVLLRDYCGADWASIAERLGRPSVHAAQQLHQRAWIQVRRRLGPRLRGDGGPDGAR